MTRQQILDNIINCWEYSPGLGKETFIPSKLAALPDSYNVHAYTDTSITFAHNGAEYYGAYEWKIKAWVFANIRK